MILKDMCVKSILIFLALISVSTASWPVDTEEYGFLGCKILRFKGFWEECIDSSNLEERTEGSCVTIAIANVILYNQWPRESCFDGIYLCGRYDGFVKRIRHTWNFDIITGDKNTSDCETDDPGTRSLPENPAWTGVDEIRELIYTVERSFGLDPEYFKTKDKSCYEQGIYPIEHVLRNRFGYPTCKTVIAERIETRKRVIRNLQHQLPVIGIECGHVYILDGYTKNKRTGKELFHSSDYTSGDESMGWFPWKHFIKEGLTRMVIDISPEYRLLKGPSSGKITFYWGDGYIPGTGQTMRRGHIKISNITNCDLGSLEISLKSEDMSIFTEKNSNVIYSFNDSINHSSITIPPEGFFEFNIYEEKKMILSIKNKDKVAKTMRVVFHDFTDEIGL